MQKSSPQPYNRMVQNCHGPKFHNPKVHGHMGAMSHVPYGIQNFVTTLHNALHPMIPLCSIAFNFNVTFTPNPLVPNTYDPHLLCPKISWLQGPKFLRFQISVIPKSHGLKAHSHQQISNNNKPAQECLFKCKSPSKNMASSHAMVPDFIIKKPHGLNAPWSHGCMSHVSHGVNSPNGPFGCYQRAFRDIGWARWPQGAKQS